MNRLTLNEPSLQPSQKAATDSNFETELCNFLAELSKASDMSTLHQNLARLKLAMVCCHCADGKIEIELRFNLTLDFRF